MTPPLALKALRAVAALPRSLRRTPRPRLIMTLLVKNEEQMLERNLLFHRAMGVDGFIVTDNNSTDSTPDILRRYVAKGWVLEVIDEPGTDYSQKQWVDRMVWRAKTAYGAQWVINADADEFWYAASGSLKDEMSRTRGNVLRCTVRSVYPDEPAPWTEWSRTVVPVDDQEGYGLSRYSIFERQNHKVAHRAAGYLQISMGNHKVTMLPQRPRPSAIVVYHYNVRGREQFLQKMVNGGKQLEQRRQRHGGRHWRYFYALWREGRLEEEYDRVVGTHVMDRLVAEGHLVNDCPLPKLFRTMTLP